MSLARGEGGETGTTLDHGLDVSIGTTRSCGRGEWIESCQQQQQKQQLHINNDRGHVNKTEANINNNTCIWRAHLYTTNSTRNSGNVTTHGLYQKLWKCHDSWFVSAYLCTDRASLRILEVAPSPRPLSPSPCYAEYAPDATSGCHQTAAKETPSLSITLPPHLVAAASS